MLPEQQVINELIEELAKDHSINPFRLAQVVQEAQPLEKRQEVTFGVGFFSPDLPPLASQERREALRNLFQKALENGEPRQAEEQ